MQDKYILWLLDSILLVGASNGIQGHLTEISSRESYSKAS